MKASLFSGQKAIEQGKRKPGLVKEVTRLSSLLNTATSLGTLHPYWFTTRLDGHFRWGLDEIYPDNKNILVHSNVLDGAYLDPEAHTHTC